MGDPHRPSDAIEHAIVRGCNNPRRWAGRLDSVGVRTLIALREMGWDVVRKPKPTVGDSGSDPDAGEAT